MWKLAVLSNWVQIWKGKFIPEVDFKKCLVKREPGVSCSWLTDYLWSQPSKEINGYKCMYLESQADSWQVKLTVNTFESSAWFLFPPHNVIFCLIIFSGIHCILEYVFTKNGVLPATTRRQRASVLHKERKNVNKNFYIYIISITEKCVSCGCDNVIFDQLSLYSVSLLDQQLNVFQSINRHRAYSVLYNHNLTWWLRRYDRHMWRYYLH